MKVTEELYTADLERLVETGESNLVEFKSTLPVNLHTGQRDSRMEQAVLKTLAGFLNSSGGALIVGISDDGTPLGRDTDDFVNEDRVSLHLTNIVNSSIGPNAWASMHANFDDYGEVRVLMVRCEKSRVPIYVKDGHSKHFFVRTGPSTTALTPSQTQEYIKQRFN